MESWKKIKIGQLAQRIISGGTPSTSKREYYGGNIPWLKTQEVNFKKIRNTETFITEEGLKNSSAKWIEANSIIVAMYGNTAAKVAINTIPLTTNQACCNITVDRSIADYRFVYYYLVKEYESLKSLSNGGAQQNLNSGIIRDYEIYLPPIKTQQRIAEILSALDDKIELNRQMNQTLEEMAQAMFKHYFVDGIDRENLPDGWRMGKLQDVCLRITKGTTPTTLKKSFVEQGINFIKVESINDIGDINKTKFNYIDDETNKLLKRSQLMEYDILFTIAGTLGRTAVLTNDYLPANTNQAVAIVRSCGGKFLSYYIYYHLRQNGIQSELLSQTVQGVQANLSLTVLGNTPIIIPQNDQLAIYMNKIVDFTSLIESNRQETELLSNTRDYLLPKLISGEIIPAELNEIEKAL
jgi:type I restriction enzyme S subunit